MSAEEYARLFKQFKKENNIRFETDESHIFIYEGTKLIHTINVEEKDKVPDGISISILKQAISMFSTHKFSVRRALHRAYDLAEDTDQATQTFGYLWVEDIMNALRNM
jgi:hypothetical protein